MRFHRRVGFSFVGSIDENVYILRSNHFQSQRMTHVLEMTVSKRTGYTDVQQTDHRGRRQEAMSGIITPFGIILGSMPRLWMWLRKRSQSGSMLAVF